MDKNSTRVKCMMWMNRWFKITCKDTTPLISELMDHHLPFGKRIRLKFHLAMCQVCRFYQNQLEVIRALARKLGGEETPSQQQEVLSEQAKTKIKDSIKQSS